MEVVNKKLFEELLSDFSKLNLENIKRFERIRELEEKVEDWEEAEKFVLGTDCPTDEIHCGCVVVLKHRIKVLEETSFTKIHCHIKSCRYNKEGLCKHTTIHLNGCSPADNVVACSEFKEK